MSSPYNTRRKSLSLSELGITVPKRHRTQSHPSPPNTILDGPDPERPVKKSKRSHGLTTLMSPPPTTTIRIKAEPSATQLSPPPSPHATNQVDVEGINDAIVVSAIQQLERTGNRPHLVKDLGAVLATQLQCVEKSANPSALISSRLTAYLNRSWPAISPCPLAKDLSPVHPRRLYFYLTTTPHQPIPHFAAPTPKLISPSLSSASAADDEDDDHGTRKRQAMSPSPEVDLSSPELDQDQHPPTPEGHLFSPRNSLPRESSTVSLSSLSHGRRGGSPQLEKEERDFKQTATALFEQAQHRRSSQDKDTAMDGPDPATVHDPIHITASIEEDTEESVARRNSDDVAALFGPDHLSLPKTPHLMEFSSPILQPHDRDPYTEPNGASPRKAVDVADRPRTHHTPLNSIPLDHLRIASIDSVLPDACLWDDLQSPETIELDELDVMFDAY